MAQLYINDNNVHQQFYLVFAAKHTSQNVTYYDDVHYKQQTNELKSESEHL